MLGTAIMSAAVAYAGAGWLVFDRLSRVNAACGRDVAGAPMHAAYTPASFGAPGISDVALAGAGALDGFDVTPYAMSRYEDVQLPSRDGVGLSGWWVPGVSPDSPAVIVVHQLGTCRRNPTTLLPAGMLNRNGFGVLLIDLREHGDSDVLDGRFSGGGEEALDVLSAWDWLRERGLPAGRIGLFGLSAGGSIVTLAAAEEPMVAATWEDGGYADVWSGVYQELRRMGLPELIVPAGMLWARLLGVDLDSNRPVDAAARLGDRPFAVVHGAADTRISPHHALDLALARNRGAGGGAPITVWFVPDAGHAHGAFAAPEEYERRLVAFFREALGDPLTP